MIHAYRGIKPRIHPFVYVAEGARIVGDVEIGRDSSVWFNAVIRGDVHFIQIGGRTNVQDDAVLHVTYEKYPVVIGSDVTIGHGAIVHVATLKDCYLIRMGAKVLDDATIGSYSRCG
jgi:carbonic anhydrase/acetyltransferase-like protein (isoleucine patch superfamily)